MDAEELAQDQQLVSELATTVQRIQDGLRQDNPPSWWREELTRIRGQRRQVRDLSHKYLGQGPG